MDIRIGVTYNSKELDLELPEDADPEDVRTSIETALADEKVLWLTDRKGRSVGVPADRIAYIELDSDESSHRIGFGG